jgi:histidine triad (HIT) family protein
MDCLFCKIAIGEIPCYKVYEDDFALAFLDIDPCAKGHTVIIPKKHFNDLSEFVAKDWEQMIGVVAEAADIIQEVIRPDGMNIGINDREAAGQAIHHAHWHIIPRWQNDGGGSIHSIIRTTEKMDVAEVAKQIKERKN